MRHESNPMIESESVDTTPPGVTLVDGETFFTVECPYAAEVTCEIFKEYTQTHGRLFPMQKSGPGKWELRIAENLRGQWYGYRIKPNGNTRWHNPYEGQLFADPRSPLVTVKNNYRQEAKTLIADTSFDWEDDKHVLPDHPSDLIIYETHIRDLTSDPSARNFAKGDYLRFVEPGQKGGIEHLKELGVNAVEFLPLQKFAPFEPPFGKETAEGFLNTWNPYSFNYWGYMTSFFFSPETMYASDHGEVLSGATEATLKEFKQLVKTLHAHGFTVIMDVVYNHTSLFDMNPLTHLAPEHFLRLDEQGKLLNRSGTGNELKTEDPFVRQLIKDSVRYWIEEFHIDGFRFDLAALIDHQTRIEIREMVDQIDPRILLIAEPWGGSYEPSVFSDQNWPSWNDRIRNTVKGSDPVHDKGFIFSDWQFETDRARLENVFRGSVRHHSGGLFRESSHAVNYLESHDGYTLADFIRIGLDPERFDQLIVDRDELYVLNEEEMRVSKFAALCLFVAQGITMIHSGQELGRPKIIEETDVLDTEIGKLDHNSYQKNNTTNWIDFDRLNGNRSLLHFYKALIAIRKQSPCLRRAGDANIHFHHQVDPLLVAFYVDGRESGDLHNYYVILNATQNDLHHVRLPDGVWEVLVRHDIASSQSIDFLSGEVTIPAVSGLLLRQLRH